MYNLLCSPPKQDLERTEPTSRFHLKGLGQQISKGDLSHFFGNLISAKITDVVVIGKRGFGYIEFERLSQYEEAKLLGWHSIYGQNVECKRAKSREQVNK